MASNTDQFLGIDIGGTNVKFGLVTAKGKMLDKQKYPTQDLRGGANFVDSLLQVISHELDRHPKVKRVGIGVPGMISKDRQSAIRMANLPEMNGLPLLELLRAAFPSHKFRLENDANAAALGELHFGTGNPPDSFLFVTLGTGVGSAAVLDGKLFLGADGNGMELGHIISSHGHTLEHHIGKAGLVRMAKDFLDAGTYQQSMLYEKHPITAKKLVKACLAGDDMAREVFRKGGSLLGEALVTAVRLLDVKHIYLGGGVSDTFDYIYRPALSMLERHLPNYYIKNLKLQQATLGNDAGIIGAAALCFVS
jgi:glucokinase